jgi:nucleoside-diphosphate-sugar epimerase
VVARFWGCTPGKEELKVAVTGASGFIGTALCSALGEADHQARALDLHTVPDALALQGVEALVHLAAVAHRRASPEELHRVNVELAVQVGKAAATANCRMIFMSSVKVHGEESTVPLRETAPISPKDAYGESKALAEEALRSISALRLTVLRPSLVYGPGVKANFLALMTAIARGIPLPLASVANRRSLIYVRNLVDVILRCLAEQDSKTYLVSEGSPLSAPQLCRAIGDALGRPARLFPFPPALLPIKSLTRSLEVDDSAIRRELGWRPRFSLEEGLRATAAWYSRR